MRVSRFVLPLLLLVSLSPSLAQTAPASPPPQLSLRQAVEIALSPGGNAALQLAREEDSVVRAQGREVRAALLPNFSGAIREQRQLVNVAALGVQVQIGGVPVTLGDDAYSTFDARVMAEQTFFDWNAIRRNQAAHAAQRSSQETVADTTQATVSKVALSYFSAMRADALAQAAASDVTLAEELARVAENRMSAGNALAIEVTRSRVQLAHARQRLLAAQDESFRARLQLCRDIGIAPDDRIVLSDQLSLKQDRQATVEAALNSALHDRPDLKAQLERRRQADLLHDAARGASFPSVYGYADYGPLGLTPGKAIETYTVGVALKIPIFDGGGREARRAEALSRQRQEAIREHDLRAQIEVEVRESLHALQVMAAQVDATEQGVTLAGDELSQARRRFDAGLMTSAELVEAQDRLERAREERVTALYSYNVALVEAARASGNVMQIFP